MEQLLYPAGLLREHFVAKTELRSTRCCYEKTAVARMQPLVLPQMNFQMVLPLQVGQLLAWDQKLPRLPLAVEMLGHT